RNRSARRNCCSRARPATPPAPIYPDCVAPLVPSPYGAPGRKHRLETIEWPAARPDAWRRAHAMVLRRQLVCNRGGNGRHLCPIKGRATWRAARLGETHASQWVGPETLATLVSAVAGALRRNDLGIELQQGR